MLLRTISDGLAYCVPLVVAVGAGLLIRVASGRSTRTLAEIAVSHGWLVWAGAAVPIALLPITRNPDSLRLRPLVWVVCGCLYLVFCWLNRRQFGYGLVAVGVAANIFAMLTSGGMPVVASNASGYVTLSRQDLRGRFEVRLRGGAAAFLGDWLPIPSVAGGLLLSPGDCLLLAGLAAILATSEARTSRAESE